MISKDQRKRKQDRNNFMCQLILIEPKIKKRREPLNQHHINSNSNSNSNNSKIKNYIQDFTNIPFTFKPR